MSVPELERSDLAWARIGDQIIFLDIADDRYFRLPDDRNRAAIEALGRNTDAVSHQPARYPLPPEWRSPQEGAPERSRDEFKLAHVAKALWTQRRVEKRIAAKSLAVVLDDLRELVRRRTKQSEELSDTGQAMLRAFDQARLIRTAADRCLARSIALSICLAASGDRSRIVMGVRSPPFGAHCWTQKDRIFLNDSLEEVLRYQPILVV